MQTFNKIKIGDTFTLERKLKNNPHQPTVFRKKSSRTATLAHNPSIWFYFSSRHVVYLKREEGFEHDGVWINDKMKSPCGRFDLTEEESIKLYGNR